MRMGFAVKGQATREQNNHLAVIDSQGMTGAETYPTISSMIRSVAKVWVTPTRE